jgi:hypothetical protein
MGILQNRLHSLRTADRYTIVNKLSIYIYDYTKLHPTKCCLSTIKICKYCDAKPKIRHIQSNI